MFGLGKKRRVNEMRGYVSNTLALLGSGGNTRASEAMQAMRAAQALADQKREKGYTDAQIAELLMKHSTHEKSHTSGRSLGYFLIAMMYDCRAINSSESLRLATEISDTVRNVLSNSASSTLPQSKESATVSNEEKIRIAVSLASVLSRTLHALDIYSDKPGRLLAPQAIGYIYGWCDAITQAFQMPKDSPEALAAMTLMFNAIYSKEQFGEKLDYEPGALMFKKGVKMLEKSEPLFLQYASQGGQELLAYINYKRIPEGIADVFA